MKISVITVTRNSLPTLRETIASVASQEGADIEHIVVDGASTDGTVEYLRACPSITKWISEPDDGLYFAMNKGLAMASGEYVGFLNSDDLYASHRTVECISSVARDTNADLIYGDLQYVSSRDTDVVIRRWRARDCSPHKLRWGWMPPHPTCYTRKSCIQSLGGFDTRYRIAADYDLLMRILLKSDVRAFRIPALMISMRTGGLSNRSISSILCKTKEDLLIARKHQLGSIGTILAKNVRKIPQLLSRA